jgi:hypothetical protein
MLRDPLEEREETVDEDPTQGRRHGQLPDEDPTQGRQHRHRPDEDPTVGG